MTPVIFGQGTLTGVGTATLTSFADASQARLYLYNAGTVTRTVGLFVKPSAGGVQQVAGVILLAGESSFWPSALSRADFGAGDKLVWSVDGTGVINGVVGGLH